MAVGKVTIFNNGFAALSKNDWALDNNFTFSLLDASLSPVNTDSLWSDISANEVIDADYSQQIVTGRARNFLVDTSTLTSADASFGVNVTISAKYLVCVRSVTAGNLLGTDELVFWVDLSTGGGAVASSNGSFIVNMPTTGWLSFKRLP